MLAHLLTGSPIPLPLQWLAAALLFGGLVAMIALSRPLARRIAAYIAGAGLLGTLTVWIVGALQPGVPPYAIRIVEPVEHGAVTSPVLLTVCGVRADGSEVPATDSQHYLVVFVDGHEVPTVDAWRFAESMPPGAHTIRVELVTPQHHAFSPPAAASVDVRVTNESPPAVAESC